jgi:acyl-CoA synthetase (AMP-forming)/AMP-acid ligase II
VSTHNVASALRRHATERPDVAAIEFPSSAYRTDAPSWNRYTFAELDRESDAYARGFVSIGVKPGDRTLMLVKPSLDFYAVLFGLFKCGAVPVLLDPGMGIPKLLECIERNQPRVVVAMSLVHAVRTFVRKPFAAAEILVTAGSRWFWGGTTLSAIHTPSDEPFELVMREASDDAAILFTSGSTGTAKGVASKQAMFAAQVEALRGMFDFEPGQRDMQAFAAFAIFDVCLGMTSVIPKMNLSKPATAQPADIVAAIEHGRCDVAFGSPIVWLNASRYCLEHGVRLDGLRTLLTVGAPIPAYLHRRFRGILPEGAQIFTPYGATEAMPISWIGTDAILGDDRQAGTWDRTAAGHGTCVGRIVPGAEVAIIEVHDEAVERWSDDLALPADTVGEVVVKGDMVSPEYKNAEQANALSKIADGDGVRHRMGDLGYLDGDGRLWFCGRKSHRLQTAAGMVPAVPVEGVFNEHADVFRTALVGVGPRGAEVPVLCVELEPGKRWSRALEGEILALAEGTPHAGLVKRVLHHPGFPTDARHNSKIRRGDLTAWAEPRCLDLAKGAAA